MPRVSENFHDTEWIVRPIVIRGKRFQVGSLLPLDSLAGEHDFGVPAFPARGRNPQVDGRGKHHSVIVVGMIPQEFDSTWREGGGRLHLLWLHDRHRRDNNGIKLAKM